MKFSSKTWLGWTLGGLLLIALLLTAVVASDGLAAGMRSGVGPIGELTLRESTDGDNWSPVLGDLAAGYSLTLDENEPGFKYLDVLNLEAAPALDDGLYPFFFDASRVPDGYWVYWAANDVNASATGWQGIMWQIINGDLPMFYLKIAAGEAPFLVDGLQKQFFNLEAPLRVNQDYPLATYHFGGEVTAGGEQHYINVQITFTRPAHVSLTTEGDVWTIDGCGYLDVTIQLSNMHDLYAVDLELAFDKNVLEVVDRDDQAVGVNLELVGNWFEAGYVAVNLADNAAGTIQFAATLTRPAEPIEGAGAVAVIRFRAKALAEDSAVTLTRAEFSDRDGFLVGRPVIFDDPAAEITTTFSAEAGLDLDIIRLDASTVQLQWPVPDAEAGIAGFVLYRSPLPYFEVGDAGVVAMDDNAFVEDTNKIKFDDEVLGNVAVNYFYALQAVCESGLESPASQQVGKFEFELFETATTDFTWIGLVLEIPGINNSKDLAENIQGNLANGSAGVLNISRWNPQAQSITTYTPGNELSIFPVSVKQPYRISVNIEGTTFGSVIWSQVGRVPEITQGTYVLYETQTTDFNWILQPLDLVNITNTNDLAVAIEEGASGSVNVLSISRWNGIGQTITSDSLGPFITRFGYPYRIAINVVNGNSVTWP
jgi:hypothetical protein